MTLSITIIIIIVTALISFSAFRSEKIMNDLIFYPPAVTQNKQYYRFITCGFIHADVDASRLQYVFVLSVWWRWWSGSSNQYSDTGGRFLYLLMYMVALVVCLLPTYFKNKNNQHYAVLVHQERYLPLCLPV